MISWNKQAADKIKCELSNQTAQTAFTPKVNFTEIFPAMIILLIIKRRMCWSNVGTGGPGRGKLS